MEKIFFSIPSFWSFRNFVYSDLIEVLKVKYEFIFLIPQESSFSKVFDSLGFSYIEYPTKPNSSVNMLLLKALNMKLLRNNKVLQNSKLVMLSLKIPKLFAGKVIHFLAILISFIFSKKILFYFYQLASRDKRYDSIIEEIEKDPLATIVATNFVVKHESVLFCHFLRLKNKKINFINSFDNTTSRGYVPYAIFDKHIVWNSKMKEELVSIFKINKDSIDILGTPQFDLLKNGSGIKLKTEDRLFNFVENENYILYCGGHHTLLPFEVKIVSDVIKSVNSNFQNLHFIIRMHPLDDWDRWKSIERMYENVVFDFPWKQNLNNPLLTIPDKYEYMRHARILNNAKMILNIGSTSSLDGCVLNIPVYNLCFKNYNMVGELDMIYRSEHFAPIIASNSAPLIYDINQLFIIITQLLKGEEPKEMSERRINFSREYCGYSGLNNFIERFDKFISKVN